MYGHSATINSQSAVPFKAFTAFARPDLPWIPVNSRDITDPLGAEFSSD